MGEANRTVRAHLVATPDPEDLDRLRGTVGDEVEITTGEEVPQPEAVDVLVAGRPSPETLAACANLRLHVVPWAGIPPATRDLLRTRPEIAVHNLHHNADAAAEMAVALLLAAAKLVVPMDRALREGRWSGRGRENPALLLAGRTALVLGYGAIGRRVAAACAALGMEVLATRAAATAPAREDGVEVFPSLALPDLLPRAEAVVVCLPLTNGTRGLIDAVAIARLPERAILVNVARGEIVEEGALYDALVSGRLHSAGIDVWYRYPGRDGNPDDTPPSRFPFGELDNVVLSPHRGGWLPGTEARRMDDLAALLLAFARGGRVPNRVDLIRGY